MKRIFLLPHRFQKIGWMVLVPCLLLGIWIVLDNTLPLRVRFYEVIDSEFWSRLWCNTAIVGTTVGAMFVACSRERVEDEMISLERLNALLMALYINMVLLVVGALAIYDVAFLTIMAVNLCALPVLFVVIWRIRLRRLRKEAQDGE